MKKGNSLPGNLPSPTHDNDNEQGASYYQDNYNNTDLCNNITITEEIPSISTNNIVENKVVGIEPLLKKSYYFRVQRKIQKIIFVKFTSRFE